MLGHAVVASTRHVFASAPGVFGENERFSSSLIKGLDTGVLDWPVNPKVQQFGFLTVVAFKTEFVEVEDASAAGGIQTVSIADFNDAGEGFKVKFSISRTVEGAQNTGNFNLEIPDIYRDSTYTLGVTGGTFDAASGEYSYNGAETEVIIEITRVGALSSQTNDKETQKLLEESIFRLTQIVEPENVAQEGTKVTASVSVRVADTTPSNVEVDLDFIPSGQTQVKIGQVVKSKITVTNNRDETDALLTLKVFVKNVVPSNFRDFSTIRENEATWPASSLTSKVEDDFPALELTKRLKPVGGKVAEVIPLDFFLSDVFFDTVNDRYFPVEINATVVGTGGEFSDTESLTVDDTCDVEITGEVRLPQGLSSILQGGQFSLIHTVKPSPGRDYNPVLDTDLEYAFVDVRLAPGCGTTQYFGELCDEKYNTDDVANPNRKRLPTTFKRDNRVNEANLALYQNATTKGCRYVPGLTMTCSGKTVGFGKAEVVFENTFQVRDTLFGVDAIREENIVLNTTADLKATGCASTNVFEGRFNIVSSTVITPKGQDGVEWWIIVLAAGGGLLLALIIALVLWKVGFFKRTKPPTDGMDNSGELDQEVAGGSVLRG